MLEFSESVSDWFIMHNVALCRFEYDKEAARSRDEPLLPPSGITMRVMELDGGGGGGTSTITAWTVLSEAELS